MNGIIAGVITGLLVVAIAGSVRWALPRLRGEGQRENARRWVRETVCHHDWKLIPHPMPEDSLVFVNGRNKRCQKCGVER